LLSHQLVYLITSTLFAVAYVGNAQTKADMKLTKI